MLGRRQQHRGMPIVAAGMHLAGVLAGMPEGIELLHRQGIHVGAQTHRPRRGPVLDDADHAGGSHAALDRNAPFSQLGGDHIGGAHLLKTQLRVGVDVASNAGDGRRLGQDGIDDFHEGSCWQRPSRGMCRRQQVHCQVLLI